MHRVFFFYVLPQFRQPGTSPPAFQAHQTMILYTLGGYNEVGKNMTAIKVRDEIVIFDMGYGMEELMDTDEQVESMSTKTLIERGILPNDHVLYTQREMVKAIVIGHGHLDHVGGVAKMAGSYKAPIVASPYTMEIVEQQIKAVKKPVTNKRIVLQAGEKFKITSTLTIEFVKVTHSIPDTMLCVLHTPEGRFAYGLDYRVDNEPVLGGPIDMERLQELGKEGVRMLIGDSTRADALGTGSSEAAVRDELRFKLNLLYNESQAVIITTFSSHIERLKSVLEVNAGRRKVAFIGRSLKDYTHPAEKLGYINLKGVELASYRAEVDALFEKLAPEKRKWLVVCTGNQGEDRSVLKRMSEGTLPYQLTAGDDVIFSSSTIPTTINKAERYKLEKALKRTGARLHFDIHASGHGHREDLRQLLTTLKPEIMIPGHGDIHKLAAHATLAQEEGYVLNENLFICENGNMLEV